jgi:hypothetical protein
MMTVEVKSSAESTREASTERDEEVRVTMIFATRSKTLAAKLTRIAMFTIRECGPVCASGKGSRGVSSSKETLLEDGAENRDGRW